MNAEVAAIVAGGEARLLSWVGARLEWVYRVVGNMLPQKPRLEQRVAEDDESDDWDDQQPACP